MVVRINPEFSKFVITTILLVVLFGITTTIALLINRIKDKRYSTNFEQCTAEKGSVIRESTPRTCISSDGKIFSEKLEGKSRSKDISPKPSETPAKAKTDCIVSGCNSEICQSFSKEPSYSICLYKPEYECYKKTKCEKQSNGNCGWTVTDELITCLNQEPTP